MAVGVFIEKPHSFFGDGLQPGLGLHCQLPPVLSTDNEFGERFFAVSGKYFRGGIAHEFSER